VEKPRKVPNDVFPNIAVFAGKLVVIQNKGPIDGLFLILFVSTSSIELQWRKKGRRKNAGSQGYSGPDELGDCERLSPWFTAPETVPQPSGTVMEVAGSWGMVLFALERGVEPEIMGSTTLSGKNFQQQSTFSSCSS
jgi:hypothetical protein